MKNRLVWPANYSTIVVVVVVLCGQALQQVAVIQTRLNFSRQNQTLSFDILILRCANCVRQLRYEFFDGASTQCG